MCHGPVVQLDRISDFGSEGWGFESSLGHYTRSTIFYRGYSHVPIQDFMKFFCYSIFGTLLFVLSCQKKADSPVEVCTDNTFFINLNASDCAVDIQSQLGVTSIFIENEDAERSLKINGIPNHLVGAFPNRGNPNTIAEVIQNFKTSRNPTAGNTVTSGKGYTFGVLYSGVSLDPYTAEFFITSNGQSNRDWNITALTQTFNLGLDCNNGHVQPTGKYHYHGTPSAMLTALDNGGSQMIKVGFAADGFPIYYKYIDQEGDITPVASGYQLKVGERPGNGQSAPDGCYDGTYFQDYEFIPGKSLLDACNGMLGKTPEAAQEYFYVITDNFPSSPLCFTGVPDASFRNGPAGRPQGFGHHFILD